MLELTAILKEHHLKVTPQRLAIFKMLTQNKIHPSAETIYNSLREEHPTMSLATVYKTLDSFVQHGLVKQLNLGEDSYRYDYNTTNHIHIQCTSCKEIMDMPYVEHVTSLRDAVTAHSGFMLSSEQLFFYGKCPKCVSREDI